jgi:hypothetical protein
VGGKNKAINMSEKVKIQNQDSLLGKPYISGAKISSKLIMVETYFQLDTLGAEAE